MYSVQLVSHCLLLHINIRTTMRELVTETCLVYKRAALILGCWQDTLLQNGGWPRCHEVERAGVHLQ